MGWAAAITALFGALTEYFLLKIKSYHQDIFYKSYDRQDAFIKEIEALSTHPSPANQPRIDILQLRLQQERVRLANLSAISATASSKSDSKNP